MERRVLLWILASTVLINVVGCATTQPTRFYMLSALPNPQSQSDADSPGLSLGIGPIELPPYLDRPQIVTRTSGNELHLAEFDKWAEPLQDHFTSVLAENLSLLLSTDRIIIFPWERSTPVDYQVTVKVTRFDATVGGDTSLIARWSIIDSDDREVLMMKKSRFSEPAAREDYDAMVSAMSNNLADLSRAIVAAIKATSQ